MSQRVAIIGAGIIGLLTARLLLQRGIRVLIVDRQAPARGASWAGGGILSPLYPWRYLPPVTALTDGAIESHRELAASLLRETGIDPEFTVCGLLMMEPPDLSDALAWCAANARRVTRCSPAEMGTLQPGLPGGGGEALWMPDIASVRNPRLLKALASAVSAHRLAECRWHARVDLRATDGREQLWVDGAIADADAILVAAGAWSAGLLAPFGIHLPVEPVRGQMLQYHPRPGLLRSMLMHAGRYLIPRRDGRILAGSTLEYTGFDASVTAAGREELHRAAVSMLPALQGVAIENHWAGLRPGAPEGIPFIDRVPGTRVFINAGHFRNGLVTSPAAAAVGAALILGEKPPVPAAPYSLSALRKRPGT